jgi:hypothetical protein
VQEHVLHAFASQLWVARKAQRRRVHARAEAAVRRLIRLSVSACESIFERLGAHG